MGLVKFDNSGYVGQSMSKNAVLAYENGEKPFSKWNKGEILNQLEKLIDSDSLIELKKLNFSTLKKYFLKYSSWHHTGKFANETQFYSVDNDFVSKYLENKEEIYLNMKESMEIEKKEVKQNKKDNPKEKKNEYFFGKIEIKVFSKDGSYPNFWIEKKTVLVIGDWGYLDADLTKKSLNGKNVILRHVLNECPKKFETKANGIIQNYEEKFKIKLTHIKDVKIKKNKDYER